MDKSINFIKEGEKKTETVKLKNDEKSKNLFDNFNNKFNLDKNKMKNNNNNNSMLGKDNAYHF